MSALLTEQYLLERSKRSNKQLFIEAMSKEPDVEPVEIDKP